MGVESEESEVDLITHLRPFERRSAGSKWIEIALFQCYDPLGEPFQDGPFRRLLFGIGHAVFAPMSIFSLLLSC